MLFARVPLIRVPLVGPAGLLVAIVTGIILLIVLFEWLRGVPIVMDNQLVHLESYNQFLKWLHNKGVDFTKWGRGKAKTAEHLWREVQKGETKLLDNPARRLVESVVIIVRQGDHILVETEQRMTDGRVRQRNWPPSEKLQVGETYLDAARRGLCEELGVTAEQIKFDFDSYHVIKTVKDSVSYPDLLAQYHHHVIEAEIQSLPAQRFATDEPSALQPEKTKTHYWDWLIPSAELLKFI